MGVFVWARYPCRVLGGAEVDRAHRGFERNPTGVLPSALVSNQILLSGWMYVWGLSECIFFVPLVRAQIL